jgi:hypothetical protein
MTTGFLAHFAEMPDLSRTAIEVAKEPYDMWESCIGVYDTDAPNVRVIKRGDRGDAKGVFYYTRLRPLAECYELNNWLGEKRAQFPVTGGWGIIGEGHDCSTDIFGALLLQLFPSITLYYITINGRFEDMTAACRTLLGKIENQTDSLDTNIFVNPHAIVMKKVLARSTRIALANRDLTAELPARKIFSKLNA